MQNVIILSILITIPVIEALIKDQIITALLRFLMIAIFIIYFAIYPSSNYQGILLVVISAVSRYLISPFCETPEPPHQCVQGR